jgi:hypothetical protein
MNDLTEQYQPLPRLTTPTPKEKSYGGWIVALLMGLLLLFLLWPGCDITPGPSPPPNPDVDGTYVLILENAAQRETLSTSQQAIFTSPKLVEWAEKNCAKYEGGAALLKIDHEEDLTQTHPDTGEFMIPPPFSELKERIRSEVPTLPAIGIVTPDGYQTSRLGEDVDRTIQFLEENK